MKKRKAVVLLSGGIDSSTVAALAARRGFAVYALSFDYGQRHRVELRAAKRIAQELRCKGHRIVKVDLRSITKSALTTKMPVPKNRSLKEMKRRIPATYVPARNTIFLSMALGYAESIGAHDIFIGANAIDYSGYPDCRPAYLRSFERLANLATKAGVEDKTRFRIHAPLLRLSKAQIIRKAISLGINLSHTHSCYDPDRQGRPCGRCDSCLIREKGLAALS